VRIRVLNFSALDHHPIHLHGHTFWVTGTEGGRIPESAWIPGNNVLVGVAQVREFEFVANNPGDWPLHCHMFHHMMNHMISGVGPGSRSLARGNQEDPRYKVPAFPQETGMMAMMSPPEMAKVEKNPRTRGMRPMWRRRSLGPIESARCDETRKSGASGKRNESQWVRKPLNPSNDLRLET